jgi:hypothetical protein
MHLFSHPASWVRRGTILPYGFTLIYKIRLLDNDVIQNSSESSNIMYYYNMYHNIKLTSEYTETHGAWYTEIHGLDRSGNYKLNAILIRYFD